MAGTYSMEAKDSNSIELSSYSGFSNGKTLVGSSRVGSACLSEHSEHLHIGDHQVWFDAILSDDADAILRCIKNAKSSDTLISGHFTYGDAVLMKKAWRGPCSDVQLPLALAAVAGTTNSILALLQAGVSPQQVDCHGNNVVHSMIAFLHYNNDMENTIITKFQLLVDTVEVDVVREILHHENSFGLRPLEFAAQHGQCRMVLAIMNTPGVYLTKQQVVGLTSYKWYNITEYESMGKDSRVNKSPLLPMTYADEEKVESLCDFVDHDIIKVWYKKKCLLNLPLIALWCLVRVLFVVVYMVYDLDMSVQAAAGPNITACIPPDAVILSGNVRLTMTVYLCVQAVVSLSLSLVSVVKKLRSPGKPLLTTLSGYKYWEVQTTLYEACYNLLCLTILFTALMLLFEESIDVDIQNYQRVICPFLACWSCFYFVQILPGIGYFITSIYRMMKSLFMLFIVYLIMIAPFVQTFYNFMNSNSLQGCISGFDDEFDVVYSLFQVMLNMINFTSFQVSDSTLLYISHMSYVFLVAIMLINFFIAVMTESFSQGSRRRSMSIILQRAEVAFSVEMMWKRVLSCYYRYIKLKTFDQEEGEIVLIQGTIKL